MSHSSILSIVLLMFLIILPLITSHSAADRRTENNRNTHNNNRQTEMRDLVYYSQTDAFYNGRDQNKENLEYFQPDGNVQDVNDEKFVIKSKRDAKPLPKINPKILSKVETHHEGLKGSKPLNTSLNNSSTVTNRPNTKNLLAAKDKNTPANNKPETNNRDNKLNATKGLPHHAGFRQDKEKSSNNTSKADNNKGIVPSNVKSTGKLNFNKGEVSQNISHSNATKPKIPDEKLTSGKQKNIPIKNKPEIKHVVHPNRKPAPKNMSRKPHLMAKKPALSKANVSAKARPNPLSAVNRTLSSTSARITNQTLDKKDLNGNHTEANKTSEKFNLLKGENKLNLTKDGNKSKNKGENAFKGDQNKFEKMSNELNNIKFDSRNISNTTFSKSGIVPSSTSLSFNKALSLNTKNISLTSDKLSTKNNSTPNPLNLVQKNETAGKLSSKLKNDSMPKNANNNNVALNKDDDLTISNNANQHVASVSNRTMLKSNEEEKAKLKSGKEINKSLKSTLINQSNSTLNKSLTVLSNAGLQEATKSKIIQNKTPAPKTSLKSAPSPKPVLKSSEGATPASPPLSSTKPGTVESSPRPTPQGVSGPYKIWLIVMIVFSIGAFITTLLFIINSSLDYWRKSGYYSIDDNGFDI